MHLGLRKCRLSVIGKESFIRDRCKGGPLCNSNITSSPPTNTQIRVSFNLGRTLKCFIQVLGSLLLGKVPNIIIVGGATALLCMSLPDYSKCVVVSTVEGLDSTNCLVGL